MLDLTAYQLQLRNEGSVRYNYLDFIKMNFKYGTGFDLNLEHPRSFNEKLQWLQTHIDPLCEICADKLRMREYVERKLGTRRYLTKIYGVWENPENIPFDDLPQKFALKTNHGCGMNILVPDKNALNREETISQLKNWLSVNYAYCWGEMVYKNIFPMAYCEEFLGEKAIDYKFYCFNGNPEFLYVADGGNEKDSSKLRMLFLDLNWKPTEFQRMDHPTMPTPEKPKFFDEMIYIAKKLSEPFYFVRIDLYCIEERIIISEITFFPGGAYNSFKPDKWEYEFGDMLEIPPEIPMGAIERVLNGESYSDMPKQKAIATWEKRHFEPPILPPKYLKNNLGNMLQETIAIEEKLRKEKRNKEQEVEFLKRYCQSLQQQLQGR